MYAKYFKHVITNIIATGLLEIIHTNADLPTPPLPKTTSLYSRILTCKY